MQIVGRLERFQCRAVAGHRTQKCCVVIAVDVGGPDYIVIAARAVPGHIVAAARRLHCPNRRPISKLTGHYILFLVTQRPPSPPLFPYTTLFRSELSQTGRAE